MPQLYLARHTLLLAADRTYPGMVTGHNEETNMVSVVWWKWGYDAPPTERIMETVPAAQLEARVASLKTIVALFGLPPMYEATINALHILKILRTIRAQFWDVVPTITLHINDDGSFGVIADGPGPTDEPEEIINGDKFEDFVDHVVYWLNDGELPD